MRSIPMGRVSHQNVCVCVFFFLGGGGEGGRGGTNF